MSEKLLPCPFCQDFPKCQFFHRCQQKVNHSKQAMQDAYDLATLKSLGENPNGTRMDVIYKAMEIYGDCCSKVTRPDTMRTEEYRSLLERTRTILTQVIHRTPTSEFRNLLCDFNMEIQQALHEPK